MATYNSILEGNLKKSVFRGSKDPLGISYQTDHGFVIGDVIRIEEDSSGDYTFYKAFANDVSTIRVVGVVSEVLSSDKFIYKSEGYIVSDGIFVFDEGVYYYLSDTVPGQITDVRPKIAVLVGFGTDKGFKVANIPKEIDIAVASSVGIPIYLHWENSDIQDSDSYTEESLESSDSSGYEFYPSDYDKALLELPSDIDCVYGVTLKESSGEILIKKFVTDPGVPNTTFLAAGIWFFQTYIRCSTVIGLSIKIYVYKRDEFGVETELFSFTQKLDDDSEIPKSYKYAFVGDNYILKKTDRLVFEYCAINSKEIFQSIELFVESITPTNIRVPFSIDLLATEIGGLTEIVTDMSVQGKGVENDPITLVNDEDTPGISKYYGTDGTGEKGFYDLPDAASGDDNYVDGATFDEGTRDLTLTRTGTLEDITVNIPCCDPAEVIQGAVTNIKYGALYNWWAANDARNIAPDGWHIPTDAEYVILREYLDPLGNYIENIAGTKLKETGLTHWQTGGGTNDVGFNARGSGVRNHLGSFAGLTTGINLWNSTPYPFNQVDGYIGFMNDVTTWFRVGLWYTSKKSGNSIRLIKDNQTDTGTMVGNDGKVYPTVTIGSQVWMAADLAETKYRNGDLISNHGETYADKYTNEEWAALTTEAMCWYEDNIENGYTDVAVIGHNALGGLQGGSTTERYHHTKDEIDTHVYEAPEDGKQYARKDGAWEEVVAGTSGSDNYVDGATFSEDTRDLTLTRTGTLEDIVVNIPCCDPAEVIQGAVTNIEYGALYNWYAATDERNIAPAGWHVPTKAEWNILENYVGGWSIAGGKLKETGLNHWTSPNTGATNEYLFNDVGGGWRVNLGYQSIKYGSRIWSSELSISGDPMQYGSQYIDVVHYSTGRPSYEALSIRLIKDDTNDTGTMVGNDGKVYPTVKIGNQVWMACNLAETEYRNGDPISFHGETYTDKYTDAEWAALTTEAMCWYDDTLDNGYTPVAVLQHNALGGIQGGSTTERYHHTKAEVDTHVFEAPIDGDAYVRKNGDWEIAATGLAIGDWTEDISFDFNDVEFGVAQTWILDIKASFAYKILSVVLQSDSTMDDVTVEIAGSPITWADDSVSIDVTTAVSDTSAKTDVDNDVAVGEQVTLVKSATDGDPTVIRGKLRIQRV